ncbi:MAG: ABC-F family ATP-binding cassette domain-containing protein, partial [Candidatus Ornithospirochaeta sp.]
LVNEVYEIFNGKLTRYSGNYTKYLEVREMEIQALEKAAKRQQEEIEKTEEFIERFRYKATKAKQVQSRIKMLEKTETIEIPGHLKKLHFSFPPCPHSGNDVMIVENLGKSYGSQTIYDGLSFLIEKGERLAITGRNGAGKSTLLRILSGIDSDYTGTVRDGAGVIKGYFAQDTENTLNPENDLIEEMETVATTADQPRLRNMLGAFLFSDDDVFKKVKVLSGGEKSRLALLKILLHPSNLLLLDEPTNHLDINAKEMLQEAIKNYGGTVVFVSHDKHFIKNLATRILYVSEEGPEFFTGGYDYFEYKLEEKEAKWKIEKVGKDKRKEEKKSDGNGYADQKARRNRLRSLEKEMEKLQNEMDAIQKEIQDLEEESGKVEVYSVADKIKAVLKEKEDKERELEKKENLWLEKSMEAEELNG